MKWKFWEKPNIMGTLKITFEGDNLRGNVTWESSTLKRINNFPDRDKIFLNNATAGLMQHAAIIGNFVSMDDDERDDYFEQSQELAPGSLRKPN